MKWKSVKKYGLPLVAGYYVVMLNPTHLLGGQETPQLAYFNGTNWESNTRDLNEPIDYWCAVPVFDKKWCLDRWL